MVLIFKPKLRNSIEKTIFTFKDTANSKPERIFMPNNGLMIQEFNLENCELCPRSCKVNRINGDLGYCNCNSMPLISSIFLHQGEEPVLSGEKGICNVFFAHCNLQCVYCQNFQISRNQWSENYWLTEYDMIIDKICDNLDNGVELLGFVSPSHQVSQMIQIIKRLRDKGYFPRVVYNTNCYDSVETLRKLEGIVDIYLPDFKYFDNRLGEMYSNVPDYFNVASLALKEMFRQKGSTLIVNDHDIAESGIIIRHLVLPGYYKDSIKILNFIADNFSVKLHISLMAQYYPPDGLNLSLPINRVLSASEYSKVLEKIEELGFRGWVQELKSADFYRPDFSRKKPFQL